MTTGWSGRVRCSALNSAASADLATRRSSPPAARSRSRYSPDSRMMTSSGCAGVCDVLPTLGSSTWAGVMKGAVTMKITSSTSITSIIGTTLIWATCLRVRAMTLRGLGRDLPLQDVGDLLHEAFHAVREAVDVVRVAVVGDHRWDRGEQAHGGGDQRLGDAGRDLCQR